MMEVILPNVKTYMILFALILLFLDYIFFLEGYLIPISLATLIFLLFFVEKFQSDTITISILFPVGIIFLMYVYRFINSDNKNNKILDIKGSIKNILKFLKRIKLKRKEEYFKELSNQFGYVIRKVGNNLYEVKFNVGIKGRGKRKFKCISYENLDIGDRVKIIHMDDDGNFYIRLV